jgi:hypothetical protein
VHRSGETVGVVEVREVPGPFDEFQLAGGHGAMGKAAVLDRDDPVVIAPDQQAWNVVHEVQAVGLR